MVGVSTTPSWVIVSVRAICSMNNASGCGVDPKIWYKVVQEGEYRDDMEGLWIQVNDWVTYVLVKHFDLQSRTAMN